MASEKYFLKKLAIDKFNLQYGLSLDPEEFWIYSAELNEHSDVSYRMVSKTNTNKTNLIIHLNFTTTEILNDFRVEDTEDDDSIFVANGTLDSYWKDDKIFQFKYLNSLKDVEDSILGEGDELILFEDGLKAIDEESG